MCFKSMDQIFQQHRPGRLHWHQLSLSPAAVVEGEGSWANCKQHGPGQQQQPSWGLPRKAQPSPRAGDSKSLWVPGGVTPLPRSSRHGWAARSPQELLIRGWRDVNLPIYVKYLLIHSRIHSVRTEFALVEPLQQRQVWQTAKQIFTVYLANILTVLFLPRISPYSTFVSVVPIQMFLGLQCKQSSKRSGWD